MPPELEPGTVIASYRIDALIGEGAASKVYRARDAEGSLVALKLLDRVGTGDERFRRRFLRESDLAARIEHPHVVRTLASGEVDGRLYLAMELIEGTDLRRRLRADGRLEPEQAVMLVEQVAGALDAAHADGLVHRDVKPGNILLSGDRAYICDFGLARHVSSVSSLTGDRGFVGTIDYVPPEQIEGGTIDGRADVYSLGCVLYECLAGARPFARDSELSVVFAHLNEPPPRLTDVRPDLPAAFDELFAIALAKSPDDRYATCGELAAAARAALSGHVVARRRPRRRLLAVVAVTLVVAAAATTAALVLSGGSGRPVTIAPTEIAGARLGDSTGLVKRLWDGGRTLIMSTPPNYSVLTQPPRNLSAYFVGTTDEAVEIATWNEADRTADGIGPCSTVADLKRVYGTSLKASPHNTHGSDVWGWTVGKHLFFGMSPTTDVVGAVAIYSDQLQNAGFNATNAGPCSRAAVSTPVARPATIPPVAHPRLPVTFVLRGTPPRLTVRLPAGWTRRTDRAGRPVLVSPTGATLRFRLDPHASSENVSTTPHGLASWLQKLPGLSATPPQTILIARPVLTSSVVDLRATAGDRSYLAAPGGPLRAMSGYRTRLYLAPVRIGSLTHTLAIALEAPAQVFDGALAPMAAIARALTVDAAAAANLSALSGFCTDPFQGTCKGELAPGTYTSTSMHPRLTYTVPVGWTNSGDKIGYFGLIPPGGDFSAVDLGGSDYIDVFTSIATGNGRCAEGHGRIHTPEKFVRWFRDQPGFAPVSPRRATIGGLSGIVVDLRMPADFTRTCPGWGGDLGQQAITGLPPSPDGMNHSMWPPPAVMRLYLLHYKGGTLGIEIDDMRGDSRLDDYTKVVRSFRFAR